MTATQALDLGRRWYADRLSPDWRPMTPAAKADIFRAVGLTGDFWDLG